MPLVYAGSERPQHVTPAHERARKIDPVYTRGEPVRVAYARNQAESDLIQNILLEEGIPSITRRTRGFDVPDFLAAGPRDLRDGTRERFAREARQIAMVAARLCPERQSATVVRVAPQR